MCADTSFLSPLLEALHPQYKNDNNKATPYSLGGDDGVCFCGGKKGCVFVCVWCVCVPMKASNEDDTQATLKCMCGWGIGSGLCICMYSCVYI